MSTGEIDLRHDALAELVSSHLEKVRGAEGEDKFSWTPLQLAGFEPVELRARFEVDAGAGLLVWVVEASLDGSERRRPVQLLYAMTADELGDVWADRHRCELRLSKYAEAHLRADLHLLQHGFSPDASSGPVLIDRKGWVGGTC